MSESDRAPIPQTETCRRLLRDALGEWVPGWRPLAENLLGAEARIDLLGRDARGRAVIALLGLEPGGDMELLGWGVAQHAWVEARLADWAQLAPEAGLSASGGIRTLLLAPHFRPAALAAAEAQPDLELLTVRIADEARGEPQLWIARADGAAPTPASRSNGASGFRSGLSAEDLDLSSDEIEALQGR